MKARTEWRVTWCEYDFQGGWWPMKPRLFDDERQARQMYNRLKALEAAGGYYDGAVRGAKLEQTVVVSQARN